MKNKIFVGGLAIEVSEEQLRGHFEQWGTVRDLQIVRDPVSGQSRGFGFLTFEDDSVTRHLIQNVK